MTTRNTTTKTAARRFAIVRNLAAIKAHETRYAVRILAGDHSKETVSKFLDLSARASKVARQLAA